MGESESADQAVHRHSKGTLFVIVESFAIVGLVDIQAVRMAVAVVGSCWNALVVAILEAVADSLAELDNPKEDTAVADTNRAGDKLEAGRFERVDSEPVGKFVAEGRSPVVEVVASLVDNLVEHLKTDSFEEMSAVASLVVEVDTDSVHKRAVHVVVVDILAGVDNE